MTEQERINENLQRQIDAQNARVSNVLTKVDMLISEMRDRDNQRAEEIREIRQDMKEMQKNLDAKIDSIGKHVRNLSLTAMGAIGAMVVTVIISLLRN